MDQEVLNLIANYGFPMFITIWFMFRTEKIINRNSDAIEKLSDVVEQTLRK